MWAMVPSTEPKLVPVSRVRSSGRTLPSSASTVRSAQMV